MSHLSRALLLVPLCLPICIQAHMQMSSPYPLRSPLDPAVPVEYKDYSMTSPLLKDGSNFPCKNYQDLATNPQANDIKATYQAGSNYSLSLAGTTTHMGGSCQISLSYDNGATFKVIQSIIGGCPLNPSYDFTIPSFAPPSDTALLSWSWFNLIGNREMYQNCARVQIQGTPIQRYRRTAYNKRQTSMDELPDMFVCNVNNGCTTIEGAEVVFPNPGNNVIYGQDGQTPQPGPGFISTGGTPTTNMTTPSNTTLLVTPSPGIFALTNSTNATTGWNSTTDWNTTTGWNTTTDWNTTAPTLNSTSPILFSNCTNTTTLSNTTESATPSLYPSLCNSTNEAVVSTTTPLPSPFPPILVVDNSTTTTTSNLTATAAANVTTTELTTTSSSSTTTSTTSESTIEITIDVPTVTETITVTIPPTPDIPTTTIIVPRDTTATTTGTATSVIRAVTTYTTVTVTGLSPTTLQTLVLTTTSPSPSPLPPTCVPGTFTCLSPTTFSQCISSGSYVYMGAVAAGMLCVDGQIIRQNAGPCTPSGQIFCNGESAFYLCDQGGLVDMGSVAPGTVCRDGDIVAA